MTKRASTRFGSRGFTLAELAVSLTLMSMILVGLSSTVLMSVSAADTGRGSNASAIQADEAMAQLSTDLASSTRLISHTSNAISMELPDRNNDGLPETVAYTWSGIAGAPLMRSYNGSSPSALVTGVQSLSYTSRTRPVAVPVTSAEKLISSCESPSGMTVSDYSVAQGKWPAQYVSPVFSADVVSWGITKVRLYIKQDDNSSKTIRVRIMDSGAGGVPGPTTLSTLSVATSALPASYSWLDFDMPDVSGLSPTQGITILLDSTTTSGTNLAIVGIASGGTNQPYNTSFVNTTNSGASWSSPKDSLDMRFMLYGTTTTLVEP